jgi:lysophospholipase L1-like esterase
MKRAALRLGILLAYGFFLLALLEGGLRLAGFIMLLPRHLQERTHAPSADEFRILAVGESTTFGLGVAHDKAYPEQLERRLNQHSAYKKFVVINTGVPGQTSTSILRSIRYQLRKYEPQVVLTHFGVNDTNEILNDLSSRILFGFKVPEFVARLRIYGLASAIRDYVLHAPIRKSDAIWTFFDPLQNRSNGRVTRERLLYQLEWNYKDVIRAIQSHGARVVIISYLRADPLLLSRLERIAREEGTLYVQPSSGETDTSALLIADGFHPNVLGHGLMAEQIYRVLQQNSVVPRVRSTVATAAESPP